MNLKGTKKKNQVVTVNIFEQQELIAKAEAIKNHLKASTWRELDNDLGRIVTYAQNQKPYLENYLLDGRCALSNNATENAIRPFTVGRKNWLFADTPKGARASATVYTIIETAKVNNLNIYTYLEYLLLYMPDTDWQNHPEEVDLFLPWFENIQAECKN